MVVTTIGHSTRPADEFVRILRAHDVELVVDVRRFPGSRRLPQYGSALTGTLAEHGIDYVWLPQLGGRRRAAPDSINDAWRHAAFRGYADHVGTDEFADGLFELLLLAHGLRTVIMCAEVLWWRCHRRLIADVLTSLGVAVEHLKDERPGEMHRLALPARLVEGRLSYEAGAPVE